MIVYLYQKENLLNTYLLEVYKRLLEIYLLERLKIFQYTINLENLTDFDSDVENIVIYPGNHDCHTILGWYKSLKFKEKVKLRRFLNKQKCNFLNINRGIIEYCLKSKARIAIIAAQDILNLDDSARINLPRKLRNRKLVLGNVRF